MSHLDVKDSNNEGASLEIATAVSPAPGGENHTIHTAPSGAPAPLHHTKPDINLDINI